MASLQRFEDGFVSREYSFSLGIDRRTRGHYLSTPVSGFNRAVEWEAYFAISDAQYEKFYRTRRLHSPSPSIAASVPTTIC